MKDTGLLPWVLVFIALLVEYCSANVEAMGSNPIEAPKFFGHLLFAIAQIAITTVISYLHLNMYCVVPENIHTPPTEGHGIS